MTPVDCFLRWAINISRQKCNQSGPGRNLVSASNSKSGVNWAPEKTRENVKSLRDRGSLVAEHLPSHVGSCVPSLALFKKKNGFLKW